MKRTAGIASLLLIASCIHSQSQPPPAPLATPQSQAQPQVDSPSQPKAPSEAQRQPATPAQARRAPVAPVPLETYFDTRRVYGVSFSADEKWVAFATDQGGRPDVWVQPIDGGDAQQITHVQGQLWTFDFSPTEDRLLYQTDVAGDENTRLYLTDHAGRATVEITKGDPKDRRAEYVDWSRDGRTLLYTSNRRDLKLMDLYEYDVGARRSKLVWRASGKLSFARVSHDHRRIALVESLSDRDSNMVLVDHGQERLLTPHQGDALYAPADFSKDGRTLLYTSDEAGEFAALYSMNLESGQRRPLLQKEWDVKTAGDSPAFRYRFVQVNADGAPRLELRDAAGDAVRLPNPPKGAFWSLLQIYRYPNQARFSPSERYLGLEAVGGATPAVPYVVDLQSHAARPVAEVLPPALRGGAMIAPESVRVKSFDGRQVPAFLYKPKEAQKGAPAVILVHGGPTAQSLQRFDPYVQYLASKGYVVLVPNVRGSTGYGKSYTLLDNKDFGGGPLKDVVACKQWLAKSGGVDPDRVVVMGGSYGGYMALAAAAFTPSEFAANVDWFGVSDLKTLVESFPPYWASRIEFIYAKFGNPKDPKDAPYLHDRSPIWFADRIQRPLMVVQGDKDVRVRQDQSDRIVQVLKEKGVPVHYLILENEGHGFSRNESRLAAYAATDRFLDRYLFGDTSVKVVASDP